MIPKLLDKLVAAGMTEQEIGDTIGRSQASVNRMRREGQTPSFPVGEKIRRLYERKCAKRQQAPK
jgi:hypothetical protein